MWSESVRCCSQVMVTSSQRSRALCTHTPTVNGVERQVERFEPPSKPEAARSTRRSSEVLGMVTVDLACEAGRVWRRHDVGVYALTPRAHAAPPVHLYTVR